jgi:hypothetical protein
VKHSDWNPCVFLLESLDLASNTGTPFLVTVIPKPAKATVRISLNKMQTHGLVFETDSRVRQTVEAKSRALFDADRRILPDSGFPGILFDIDVGHTISGELWKLLLNPDDAALTAAERVVKMRRIERIISWSSGNGSPRGDVNGQIIKI